MLQAQAVQPDVSVSLNNMKSSKRKNIVLYID